MLLRVIVHEPEDYKRWVAKMKAPVPPPTAPLAEQGRKDFFANSCVNCHQIDGTIAKGRFGPNLTKLMSRQTIGAGVAPLNQKTLSEWLQDPQKLKAGCLMPDMKLQPGQIESITAYLMTLQ